jgi:hypothetical protein
MERCRELSDSHQREHVEAIEEAKKPETHRTVHRERCGDDWRAAVECAIVGGPDG